MINGLDYGWTEDISPTRNYWADESKTSVIEVIRYRFQFDIFRFEQARTVASYAAIRERNFQTPFFPGCNKGLSVPCASITYWYYEWILVCSVTVIVTVRIRRDECSYADSNHSTPPRLRIGLSHHFCSLFFHFWNPPLSPDTRLNTIFAFSSPSRTYSVRQTTAN